MDSRYDVTFPEWLVDENELAYADGNWSSYVKRFPTDAILAARGSRMESALDGEWKRVYRDAAFSIYARPGLGLPPVDRGTEWLSGTLP
jgi:hypothetical protein